jgi:Leucine-rich repeat (LRR) protein
VQRRIDLGAGGMESTEQQKKRGVLNLVGHGLVDLDSLWSRPTVGDCQKIQTLYLSDNAIHSLNDIDRFSSLTSLSCCNNNLTFFDQIDCLSRLKSLTKLSLTGNRVTLNPFYREVVTVSICVGLTSLDGIKLSRVEQLDSNLV